MNVSKYIFLAVVIFFMCFVSCEKKLDIDLPDSDKHLVLNGIISTDSCITVRLSQSQNALDNNDITYIQDAEVYLYVNGEEYGSLTHTSSGMYQSDVIPEIESSYMITADNGQLQPISAQVNLAAPTQIHSIDTTVQVNNYDYEYGENYQGFEIQFSINFSDNENSDDFYFLAISSIQPIIDYDGSGYPYFEGFEEYYYYYDSNDPIFRFESEFTLNGIFGNVFTDEIFNGTNYTIDVSLEFYPYYEYDGFTYDEPVPFIVKLLKVNRDIYRYIISYNLNQQSEFDPFAQPVSVYTNVENGLGLFSGYTMYADTLFFDPDFFNTGM